MFYWGPSEPLQERPASFFPPTGSVDSLALQVRIWGLGAGAEGEGDEELCPSPPAGSLLAPPQALARDWNTKLFLFMILSVGWPLSRQLVLSFEAILECAAPFIENRRQCAD